MLPVDQNDKTHTQIVTGGVKSEWKEGKDRRKTVDKGAPAQGMSTMGKGHKLSIKEDTR